MKGKKGVVGLTCPSIVAVGEMNDITTLHTVAPSGFLAAVTYCSRSKRLGQTPWCIITITTQCVMTYGLYARRKGIQNCEEERIGEAWLALG